MRLDQLLLTHLDLVEHVVLLLSEVLEDFSQVLGEFLVLFARSEVLRIGELYARQVLQQAEHLVRVDLSGAELLFQLLLRGQ